MTLVENWATVLWRSASLRCVYVASLAQALHLYIASTPVGIIPGAWVQTVDGWAVTIGFVAGLAAIPARGIKQASLSAEAPK